MKKTINILIFVILSIMINSCSTTEQVVTTEKSLKFSILCGANMGGITDNTDMSVLQTSNEVDAISGATRTGFNVGIHINREIMQNQIELGIDYMYNHQTFTYNDADNSFIGVRELGVSQLLFPFTYNFLLFKKHFQKADIQIKVGYLGQLNFISINEEGILPNYSINKWSHGVTLGISAYLFQFNNRSKLGFYFDLYRGSQIYEDYYNQTSFEMPGSSFIKFGIKYQFK